MRKTLFLLGILTFLCVPRAYSAPGDTDDDATLRWQLPSNLQADPFPLWIIAAREIIPSIQVVPDVPDVLLLLFPAEQIVYVVRRDPGDNGALLIRCVRLRPSVAHPRAIEWCRQALEYFADRPR